VKYAPS
jgi:hypothetical protein